MTMVPHELVRRARHAAGLSQAELARRLGTSQPEIARLESARSNPRVGTLRRAIEATGHRLEAEVLPLRYEIDETLLASNLAVAPSERLQRFAEAYDSVAGLAAGAGRSRGS
jgi:transcriptional regulator with XRE-family HTH domain